MYRKVGVDILGMVENMAFLELPDGSRQHIFGEGGVRRAAEQAGVELLGEVPLDMVRRGETRQPCCSLRFLRCSVRKGHRRRRRRQRSPCFTSVVSGHCCGSSEAFRS